MANEVSGIDRRTGKLLVGWPYVIQSVETIMTTGFFVRVMRPHVGSNAHKLIGELANQRTAMRFRWALALAILQFVPNFKPERIDQVEVDRDGRTAWVIDGIYYPRGHLGDFTHGSRRSLVSSETLTSWSSIAA